MLHHQLAALTGMKGRSPGITGSEIRGRIPGNKFFPAAGKLRAIPIPAVFNAVVLIKRRRVYEFFISDLVFAFNITEIGEYSAVYIKYMPVHKIACP